MINGYKVHWSYILFFKCMVSEPHLKVTNEGFAFFFKGYMDLNIHNISQFIPVFTFVLIGTQMNTTLSTGLSVGGSWNFLTQSSSSMSDALRCIIKWFQVRFISLFAKYIRYYLFAIFSALISLWQAFKQYVGYLFLWCSVNGFILLEYNIWLYVPGDYYCYLFLPALWGYHWILEVSTLSRCLFPPLVYPLYFAPELRLFSSQFPWSIKTKLLFSTVKIYKYTNTETTQEMWS